MTSCAMWKVRSVEADVRVFTTMDQLLLVKTPARVIQSRQLICLFKFISFGIDFSFVSVSVSEIIATFSNRRPDNLRIPTVFLVVRKF